MTWRTYLSRRNTIAHFGAFCKLEVLEIKNFVVDILIFLEYTVLNREESEDAVNSLQIIREAMEKKGYGVAHVAYRAKMRADVLEQCLNGTRQMKMEDFLVVCSVLELSPTSFGMRPGSPEWNDTSGCADDLEYVWYYLEETETVPMKKKSTLLIHLKRDRMLYVMLLPMFLLLTVYHYLPMFGLVIAFKDYKPLIGFAGSRWVGLKHFASFFRSTDAAALILNTVILNVYGLLFAFPCPVVFALLLSELKNARFKRLVQTISYLPHFLSVVVVVGLVQSFLSPMFGSLAQIYRLLGLEPVDFMRKASAFRPIYILSGIWQNMGWDSIIYLSAISSIDPSLYEAAVIDGATSFKRMLYITLPCIANVIIVMLIMSLGNILNVGFEKVLLLQNSFNYSTANVISTYVYKRGLVDMGYSFGTAVGLFNSAVGLVFVTLANFISKRVTDVGLW